MRNTCSEWKGFCRPLRGCMSCRIGFPGLASYRSPHPGLTSVAAPRLKDNASHAVMPVVRCKEGKDESSRAQVVGDRLQGGCCRWSTGLGRRGVGTATISACRLACLKLSLPQSFMSRYLRQFGCVLNRQRCHLLAALCDASSVVRRRDSQRNGLGAAVGRTRLVRVRFLGG